MSFGSMYRNRKSSSKKEIERLKKLEEKVREEKINKWIWSCITKQNVKLVDFSMKRILCKFDDFGELN